MQHLESTSLGVWVKSGSRSEHDNEHGISHLLEHMAFKGTKTRSATQIAQQIENVGGDLNAATSIEHTGYFARILKQDNALAIEILSDILQNSLFEKKELSREQQVIVQEIGASHDDPDDQTFDMFQSAAYPKQAIGRTILGTKETVCNFTPSAIRNYMDRNYVGNNMIVSAAGNIEHDALVNIVQERFKQLKTSKTQQPKKAIYVGGENRLISNHEQAHIIIGIEGRAYNSEGFYATQILTKILGGSMSSRLFQEVREKRGLCYSIYSFHWAFADSGILGIAAATGSEQVSELVPTMIEELKRIANDITQEEVTRVRTQIRASLLMSLENPSVRSAQIARQQILWGRYVPMAETVERINRVSVARVKQIASELLDEAKPTIAALGPIAKMPNYEAIKQLLAR